MEIGYAQSIITPDLSRPVFLAGFGHNRRARSVHDDLFARALVIKDAGRSLVLCALDVIGLFRPDVLDIVNRVQVHEPGTQAIIASTHTHHGPDTLGLWGPTLFKRGVDQSYMAFLKEKTIETILTACKTTENCPRVKATATQVEGVAKNARNPAVVDNEMVCVQFLKDNDRPFVTLVNFPCHPEVLWEHNPHITSDYPSTLRTTVEQVSGSSCIFFAGALGGMMTPDVVDHSFEEADLMGKTLANRALESLSLAKSIDLTSWSRRTAQVNIQLTNPLYKFAFLTRVLPDFRNRRGQIQSEVTLVQVGPAWFFGVPGELLPAPGLNLKAALKNHGARVAGIIGLANDELGYLLPEDEFIYPANPFKPGDHYEETNSIGKEAGPAVIAAAQSLLALND